MPDRPIRESLVSPSLRDLYDYWQARRGGRSMPARRDIDPVDIPALLPYLALFDVVQAGARFRVRLIGTHVTETLGRDDTGHFLDAVYPEAVYARMAAVMRRPIETRAPVHSRAPVYFDTRHDFLDYEAIHLPLSADAGRVDMLLSGFRFLPRPRG